MMGGCDSQAIDGLIQVVAPVKINVDLPDQNSAGFVSTQ